MMELSIPVQEAPEWPLVRGVVASSRGREPGAWAMPARCTRVEV